MKTLIVCTLALAGITGLTQSADADNRRAGYIHYLPAAGVYDSIRPDPTVQMVQLALQRRGYYTGVTSGEFVWETRDAIRRYRRNNGLREIGKVDRELLGSLGLR